MKHQPPVASPRRTATLVGRAVPLPMTEHVWQQERTLHDMMARFGIDAVVAVRIDAGEAYWKARTKCIDCVHARACQAWLGSEPGAADVASVCPNRAFFRDCGGKRNGN